MTGGFCLITISSHDQYNPSTIFNFCCMQILHNKSIREHKFATMSIFLKIGVTASSPFKFATVSFIKDWCCCQFVFQWTPTVAKNAPIFFGKEDCS